MRNRLGAVMAAVMLAGCGHSYAPIQAPAVPGYGPRTFSRQLQSPQAVLSRANDAYKAADDFVAEVTTWTAERPGDERTVVYGEANLTFKKPMMQRLDVTKASDDQKKVGSSIVTDGSDKAKVLLAKPIPIFGRLFTLKLSDKRLVSNRGMRLDQMGVPAMLARLGAPGTTLDPQVKDVTIEGRKCLLVTATGSFRGIDREVTSEEVAFDTETGLPVMDVALVGSNPVLKLGVRNLRVNVGVPDSAFNLQSRFALR